MQKTSPAPTSLAAARARPTFMICVALTLIGCIVLALAGYVRPVVMGIVQGLGEFLPISSSAHLILTPWFLGWTDPGLTFDVALHVGTLAAVLLVFGREWLQLLGAAFAPAKDPAKARLFWQLLAASVPGAVMGVLLEHKAEHAFRNPLLLAGTLSGMGLLLLWMDRAGRKDRGVGDLTLPQALVIGVAQGLAVIPGVSRAGITMAAALGLG